MYDKLVNFVKDYEVTIKNTLLIPLGFELKLISSGKYSTLIYTDSVGQMVALYTGPLQDIYQFVLNVIKVNYFREENKGIK